MIFRTTMLAFVGVLCGCSAEDYRDMYGSDSRPSICLVGSDDVAAPGQFRAVLTQAVPDSNSCAAPEPSTELHFQREDGSTAVVGLGIGMVVDWRRVLNQQVDVDVGAQRTMGFYGGHVEIRTIDGELVVAARRTDEEAHSIRIDGITIDSRGSELGSSDADCGSTHYRRMIVRSEPMERQLAPGVAATVISGERQYEVRCFRNERFDDNGRCTDGLPGIIGYAVVSR